MLDEDKSKIKEFEEVVQKLQVRGWNYHNSSLTDARQWMTRENESVEKAINEPLELTEGEKRFHEEYKAGCHMAPESLESPEGKFFLYTFAVVHTKEELNQMKPIYRLALEAQKEVCGELLMEALREREKAEWFISLTPENKQQARLAMGKLNNTFIKLQNEILQMWERQLASLHYMIAHFPPID